MNGTHERNTVPMKQSPRCGAKREWARFARHRRSAARDAAECTEARRDRARPKRTRTRSSTVITRPKQCNSADMSEIY